MQNNSQDEAPTPQDMLQLNRPRSIVPPMQDVVGNTYAETRSEREAKQRAELESELALARAREEAAQKPKKAMLWLGVLSIIFLLVALAGVGFGVLMYTENTNLKEELDTLNKNYSALKIRADELEDNYSRVQSRLDALLGDEAE